MRSLKLGIIRNRKLFCGSSLFSVREYRDSLSTHIK